MRKDKRQQKKLNRFHYHNEKKDKKLKGKDAKLSQKKKIEDEMIDSENGEFGDEEIPSSEEEFEEKEAQASKKTENGSEGQLERFLSRQKKEQDEYFNEMKKSRVEQLSHANEEEDKIIGKYEKLLKLNKKKRKDEGMGKFNDGLDYLLELCTDDSIQKMYKAAKEAAVDSDNEEMSYKPPTKKSKKPKSKAHDSEKEEDSEETEEIIKKSEKLRSIEKKYLGDDEDFFNNLDIDSCDGSDSELEEGAGETNSDGDQEMESDSENSEDETLQNEDSLGEEEEAESGSEGELGVMPEDSSEKSDNDSNDSEEEEEEQKAEIREDIYGRKRDKDGNLVQEDAGKYIPPHLRKSFKSVDTESDPKRREKLQNLKRQINGYINRLAEANLHRISIDIENVYNSNSRNDTNTVLIEIILNALVSNVLSRERLILEHTLLISVLHANLGSEIGAFFLQVLIEKFDKLFKSIDVLDVENKELDNIIFIICHLYTYRLFKHGIIFEMLNKLCEKLSEKRIECVLLVLKSIGFILRKDDPVALKEFILKAQKLLNTNEATDKSSRVSFMLDILMAIKNNNMTKIPQYDASLVDHFRKLLKQFVRAGKYVTTLALTMDDLLNAEERGKWWLVGSAWAGNDANSSSNSKQILSVGATVDDEQRNKILALAKKQRMNTDAKRNVFYVLMTAEDYIDAFEKILSATSDERTIIAVILHCCLSEKEYNAYYSVLAQKFCEHNRKYLLATQFAVWDRIKEVHDLTAKQISNLSRFLIFLIENDNLPLSVLKVVEFTEIEKTALRLVRQVMLGLLLTKEENFHRIFEKISQSFKLNAFKDQLRLFLKVFLLKDESKMKISDEQMSMLRSRLNLAEKFLAVKQF
jgi:nucleolar MIF4G domain-containing protein 1